MTVYMIEAVIATSKEQHEKGEGNEHNREFATHDQARKYGELLESHPLAVSYLFREAPQTAGADYKHHKQWPAQKRAVVLAPEDHMAALQAEIDEHKPHDEMMIAHDEHEHSPISL